MRELRRRREPVSKLGAPVPIQERPTNVAGIRVR